MPDLLLKDFCLNPDFSKIKFDGIFLKQVTYVFNHQKDKNSCPVKFTNQFHLNLLGRFYRFPWLNIFSLQH